MKTISEEDRTRLSAAIADPEADTSYMDFKKVISNFGNAEEESK